MQVFYSDHIKLPLPDGHRFPMPKYSALHKRLVAGNVGKLVAAEPVTEVELRRVHSAEYIAKIRDGTLTKQEIRRIGFPWSPSMYQRAIHSAGGTLCAARAALDDGISAHLAGGTHHAHYDWGQGFCIFNDVVVAARALQHERLVERVLVIDLDVHQGNGTALLCQDDDSIFTFSIHGAKNFPFKKERGDFDIALADGAEDAVYLEALQESLWRVLTLARADFAFYIAGADPYRKDRLGKMALTKDGLKTRDRMVFEAIKNAEFSLGICMGGGYSPDINDIVDIQAATIRVAADYTD